MELKISKNEFRSVLKELLKDDFKDYLVNEYGDGYSYSDKSKKAIQEHFTGDEFIKWVINYYEEN